MQVRTEGALVKPLRSHSLTSAGASTLHAFALCTNGSLMRFTVKPFVARMLAAVSFNPLGVFVLCRTPMETTGGSPVTILNQLRCFPLSQYDSARKGPTYLNGARFSTPSADTLETNAMGRGTMPLIISLYMYLPSPC